jgi:hypothetical protein
MKYDVMISYIHTYIHTYMCVHIYICACMQAHTHTHTHMYTFRGSISVIKTLVCGTSHKYTYINVQCKVLQTFYESNIYLPF